MNDFYNLWHQKWILCLDAHGVVRKVTLSEILLNSHQFVDLADPYPVVNAAMLRFLAALLMDIFQPKIKEDFEVLWKGKFPEKEISDYMDVHQHRFHLFSPQLPFYQCPDPRVKPKPVLKMAHHIASGNNATLFDHHTEATGISLKPDEAARYLITIQAFGLGGLSGIPEKFTNAQALKGINFFIKGDTLYETLFLNLFAYREDKAGGIPNSPKDAPAWRMENPFTARTVPNGLLDYLTWQNRRILLIPEESEDGVVVRQMTEGPGLRLDDRFINGMSIRDPFHFYYQGKKDIFPLKFSEDKMLWRDSASLFMFEKSQEGVLLASENLLHFTYLINEDLIDSTKLYRLAAMGMASDKAKVLFYRDEELPLPDAYLNNLPLVFQLREMLDITENASHKLFGAVSLYARLVVDQINQSSSDSNKDKSGEKKLKLSTDAEKFRNHLGAERFFWIEAEKGFLPLLYGLVNQPEKAVLDWKEHTYRSAFVALENSVIQSWDNPRYTEARVVAEKTLRFNLKSLRNEEVES